MSNTTEYSRQLSNFRGIDATSEASNVALNRFHFAQNMYKDYRSGQGVAIETFPGTRELESYDGAINGMFSYKSTVDGKVYIVLHAGTKLYRFPHKERDSIPASSQIFDGMNDSQSCGFIFNNRLYILDGTHYVAVDEEGVAKEVTEDEAYIPTTYSNGVQYEQRNMLTDKFKERGVVTSLVNNYPTINEAWLGWTLGGDTALCSGLEVRDYGVDEEGYSGVTAYSSSDITIPFGFTGAKINLAVCRIENIGAYDHEIFRKDQYEVDEPMVWQPTDLVSVTIGETVRELSGSFEGATNLSYIKLSNLITSLDKKVFAGTAIEEIRLPISLKYLGKEAFDGCTNLKKIYAPAKVYKLEMPEEEFAFPEGVEVVRYDSDENPDDVPSALTGDNKIYVYTPCLKINKVTLGKKEIPSFADVEWGKQCYVPLTRAVDGQTYIYAIEILSKENVENVNEYIHIEGEAAPSKFVSVTEKIVANEKGEYIDQADNSYAGNNPDYNGTSVEAIKGCKVVCTYDDRVFFTGNPRLPNTVFYTQRDLTGHNNPTYVGVLNYFNDGVGNTPNVAMMSNASMLMVLKADTLQDGSIYYHTGADGGNDLTPRIYPSTEGLAGLGCVGLAVNFRDDCTFLSRRGLEGVSKQAVNLERTIGHRSTNIDPLLIACDLSTAKAAEWEGYLCILVDGKMFLADSRQMFEGVSGVEYEWYYIDRVCTYIDDHERYIYADYLPEALVNAEYKLSEKAGEGVEYESVNSEAKNGVTVYYVVDDGIKYLLDRTGEREGGEEDLACNILCVDDVLYFGTEGGQLLCLNNDKRGTNEHDDDKSHIPTNTYNRSGHAYDAVCVLCADNAGIPHFTKTTIKRGTVLRLKSFDSSCIEVSASTDRQETTLLGSQSNSATAFDEVDFSNLGLLTTASSILAIKEKTKKWVEKQYVLKGRTYNTPFGIYSLTYRYIISGKVK